MKKLTLLAMTAAGGFGALLLAQDVKIVLTPGEKVPIAVPTLRGSGDAEKYMAEFNTTLWNDLDQSGVFRIVAKTFYPLQAPQRPQDFRAPLPPQQPARRGAPPPQPVRQGPWLSDWSGPPVNAKFLAFGYTGVQDGQMVLFGWLYDVTQADLANAQVFGKVYFGPLDQNGARKVAHDFATDILGRFGGQSLAGSKIYFTSTRSGSKEIWSMDADGSNQKQLTFYKSTTTMPAVSPDGTRLLYTTFARGNPRIEMLSLETGNRLPFYNQNASLNATADFTPDGKQIVYASTAAAAGYAQIYLSGIDGRNLHRISSVRAIEMEPKVNPKTGNEIVFISDRAGLPQIYRMSLDGTDVTRLTSGEGEAVNPAWHPDGQHIAFAWTRGFAPGNYNIFVMDVTTRELIQLTHGAGRNENPTWAPDGRHLAFSSNRGGRNQIYTMLADGTQIKPLTTQGVNEKPVWGKR